MPRKAVVLIVVVGLVATSSAVAAVSRDSYVRRHLSFTQTGVFLPGNQEGLSVNFVTPPTWTPVKQRSKTHLSFHQGSNACRFSVTLTTSLAEDTDETPLEHVTTALPVAGAAYVLDQGTRNSTAAWRVTRLKTNGPVQLRAMRADHRLLGGGTQAWQETVVSATSRAHDECHAGTYRAALGPQIGDALAGAVGRAYSFTPKTR